MSALLLLCGLILCEPFAQLLSAHNTACFAEGVSASAPRWLWLPTKIKQQDGCEDLMNRLGQTLAQRLTELTGAQLLSDGQMIPCEGVSCVSSRREAMGSAVALELSGECFSNKLEVTALVAPQGAQPLSYVVSASREGPAEREAHQAALTLVQRVIKGPPPPPQAPPASPWRIGVGLLGRSGAQERLSPKAPGGQLELAYEPLEGHGRQWLLGVTHEGYQDELGVEAWSRLFIGARQPLANTRLAPIIGAQLALARHQSAQVIDQPLAPLQDGVGSLEEGWFGERRVVTRQTSWEARPALELGAQWRGSRLAALVSLRFEPLNLMTFNMGEASWSLLTALSW